MVEEKEFREKMDQLHKEIESIGDRLIEKLKAIENKIDDCKNELIATMREKNKKINARLDNIADNLDRHHREQYRKNDDFDVYYGGTDSNGEFEIIPPGLYKIK